MHLLLPAHPVFREGCNAAYYNNSCKRLLLIYENCCYTNVTFGTAVFFLFPQSAAESLLSELRASISQRRSIDNFAPHNHAINYDEPLLQFYTGRYQDSAGNQTCIPRIAAAGQCQTVDNFVVVCCILALPYLRGVRLNNATYNLMKDTTNQRLLVSYQRCYRP